MRHDHVEAIDCTALEEADENRTVGRPRRPDGLAANAAPREEQRIEAQAHKRQTARLHEHPSGDASLSLEVRAAKREPHSQRPGLPWDR